MRPDEAPRLTTWVFTNADATVIDGDGLSLEATRAADLIDIAVEIELQQKMPDHMASWQARS
ncbi:hypothetical protein Q2941_50880 [Bradyrhizobium sp. UFLA05-153]